MKVSIDRWGRIRLVCLLVPVALLFAATVVHAIENPADSLRDAPLTLKKTIVASDPVPVLGPSDPINRVIATPADVSIRVGSFPGEPKAVRVLGVISDVEATGLKPEPPKFSGTISPATVTPSTAEELNERIANPSYPKTDSPEKLTLEQLEAIAKLPPKKNKSGVYAHPAMVPLFRDMVLNYTGGNYKNAPIHFRLHTPEPYEKGKKYPMVVWLHGIGECGSDNIDQLSHLHHIIPSLVGPKKRDFFLLVPQCPHTHSQWEAPQICSTTVRSDGSVQCKQTDDPVAIGNAPISFTIAMIEAMLADEKYPVDPNRITVAGLSSGGRGVWKFLERRPDLFAAAVPIVSWDAMSEKSLREKPLLKKIPIWAIYSSDDNGIDRARKEFQRMVDRGCRASKTEFGVCGHRAWTPAMLQGDVFGWLISRAKDGDRYYAAEPSPTDPEKIGAFADVTVGDLAKKKPTLAPAKPEKGPEVKKDEKQVAKPKERTPIAEFRKKVEERKTQAERAIKEKEEAFWRQTAKQGVITQLQKFEAQGRKQAGVWQWQQAPAQPTPPPKNNRAFINGSGSVVVSKNGSVTAQGKGLIDVKFSGELPAPAVSVSELRLKLIARYIELGEIRKAMAVADKVQNRLELVHFLLEIENKQFQMQLLDYADRELDRMEGMKTPVTAVPASPGSRIFVAPRNVIEANRHKKTPEKKTLEPIPAGKKSPMDECGKEWAMSTTTQYGMFPNGWDQEAKNVPDYVINENGPQLCKRLAQAYIDDDLNAMREFCNSFIKLDDIPLSSPWFDTSGGRLKGRIKYTINDKAKPVVMILRHISLLNGESKKEFSELAKKALERIDAITNPKVDTE